MSFRPPASLLTDCAPPPVDANVLADIAAAGNATAEQTQAKRNAGLGYVRYVHAVHGGYDECNAKFAALRAYAAKLREAERDGGGQ